MDGVELELVCPCGFENFERIVVQRKPHAPVVTDFVACVGCKAMYWAPLRRPEPEPARVGPIGPVTLNPERDSIIKAHSECIDIQPLVA